MTTRRERIEARLYQRQEWAEKANVKSQAEFVKADEHVERFAGGQPIIVGHHSEASARRDRERSDNAMRRGIEREGTAARHDEVAGTLKSELDRSIYLDDPEAKEHLTERIAHLEARREHMKGVNKAARRLAKTNPDFTTKEYMDAVGLTEGDDLKGMEVIAELSSGKSLPGYPSYQLTNLSGRINRERNRLKGLTGVTEQRTSPAEPQRQHPQDEVTDTPQRPAAWDYKSPKYPTEEAARMASRQAMAPIMRTLPWEAFTSEERARVEAINAEQEAAFVRHYQVDPSFNLTAFAARIATERRDISRAARRRQMAAQESTQPQATKKEPKTAFTGQDGAPPLGASPQPEEGPPKPLPTLHGQQVTLGEDFATNRNLSMPLTTQDFGEKAGPLTTTPPKLDPGQSHFLPETPGNALADPELAPPIAPDPPAEDLLFSAPMTEEQSRRAGSGLETDAETGRILTPSERWEMESNQPSPPTERREVESNQPPPEPEAQPEKPAAEPQPEPAQTVKPPTERREVESNQPPPEPEAQPEKPTAEPQPEPQQTVKPSPERWEVESNQPPPEPEAQPEKPTAEPQPEPQQTVKPSPERWEVESNQPPPEPEAQPEKPTAEPQPEPARTVKPPTERWEIEADQPSPEPEPQPEKPAAEPQPEPARTVKPPPEPDREPDEAAYQRARMDRDCPLPDGDACIAIVKPDTLRTDAKLFQYKAETDDQGVSVKLADVKTWDPDLAGVAYVWERADGERFIVDGHQRLALAQRLRNEGQDPELLVKIWREADGYTPRTMRLSAAKKNIAEGSGTAVDAARVLREEPGLFDTLSQKNAIVRDARGLAQLDQDVFSETVEYVNAGHLPENVASLIAGVGTDPALQRGTLREFVREQRRGHITRTAGENLLYAIRRNRLDEVEAKAQGTLTGFDVGAVRESAWRERAALQQGLVNAFRNDRRLFGEVVRGDSRLESVGNVLAEESNESELTAAWANIEIFDRLANKRGPLADYLDAEAVRIKKRMDETGASRQGAAAAATRDSARYLRPFLKTYIQDRGAALAGNLAVKKPAAPKSEPTSGEILAPTAPSTVVTITPEIPDMTPAPQPGRRRVTSAEVAAGKSEAAPAGANQRQPVTVEAVKQASGPPANPAPAPRRHIKAPTAEKCPASDKGPKQPQPKSKGRTTKQRSRRTARSSMFTPGEVRRFQQMVSRINRQ